MTTNTKYDDDELEIIPVVINGAAPVPDTVQVDEEIQEQPPVAGKTCIIVAPSTLAEGYTFSANVDGIDFTVTVPRVE
jgi:hypothetical protein